MKSLVNRTFTGGIAAVALTAMVAVSAIAQGPGGFGPGPGGNGGMDMPAGVPGGRNMQGGFGGRGGFGNFTPAPIMKVGSEGIYVFQAGTLTKYNTALKEQGSLTLQEKPASSGQESNQAPRPVPAAISITGEAKGSKIIVVIGDKFLTIDEATFKITNTITLPTMAQKPAASASAPIGRGQGQRNDQFGFAPSPAVLEVHGQTVYVLRGNEIVSVDLVAGKASGMAVLPKPAAPQVDPGS